MSTGPTNSPLALTLREEESKKAHKPALARSVRIPGSSALSIVLPPANEPRSALLQSRARIELLWDSLLLELQEDP